MRLWTGLCLGWLLGGLGGAEPWTVRILTVPEGAQVFRVVRGGIPGNSQREIGRTGQQLVIEVPNGQETVTLQLAHPDCKPTEVLIKREDIRGGSIWPSSGTPFPLEYLPGKPEPAPSVGRRSLPVIGGLLALAGVLGIGWRLKPKVPSVQAEWEVAPLETPARHNSDPLVGAHMDGYQVEYLLGAGGMARVYRAREVETGTLVAIKVLNPALAEDVEVVRRFAREREIYSALRHPHIVQVLASGSYMSQFFIVMEYVEGDTLRSRVLVEGMPARRAVQLLEPALEAVAYAHRKGIVHRDLKPENIMVSAAGKLKVMDFGLARGEDFQRVTATGAVMGTPAYISPEQVQGTLHPQSDQYALGVMLYELISGSAPFQAETPLALIMKHVTQAPPRLADLNPAWGKISEAVDRMLAKDPDKRFRDLDHALKVLKYAADQ